jgi:intein/homing endonuclease
MESKYKNPDFSYLIGALADGSLYSNKKHYIYRVTYYQHSQEYLKHCIEPRVQELFNKKGYYYFDKRKSVYFFEVSSKEIYLIYLKYTESLKAYLNRSVPSWIKQGNKSLKFNFISGFFDADGFYYLVPEKNDFRVRLGQAEFQVLQDIKEMLEVDFKCSDVLGPYQSKEGVKPYFELHIYGINQVKKFHSKIKPCHPDKQLDANQLKKPYQAE